MFVFRFFVTRCHELVKIVLNPELGSSGILWEHFWGERGMMPLKKYRHVTGQLKEKKSSNLEYLVRFWWCEVRVKNKCLTISVVLVQKMILFLFLRALCHVSSLAPGEFVLMQWLAMSLDPPEGFGCDTTCTCPPVEIPQNINTREKCSYWPLTAVINNLAILRSVTALMSLHTQPFSRVLMFLGISTGGVFVVSNSRQNAIAK